MVVSDVFQGRRCPLVMRPRKTRLSIELRAGAKPARGM
jgi:hypothetical protein